MAELTAAHARDLGDYVSLARRRWAWIVGSLVLGVAIAFIYLGYAPTTYVSTSKVLVKPTGSPVSSVGARTNDPINLDTEAQLVRSEPVTTRAVELLGSPLTPVQLAQHVTVTVPANTTVMAIAFAAPTAEEAQQGAATFARAYLESREKAAQDDLAADVRRLQGQIDRTTQDIQDTSVAISRMTGPQKATDRAFLIARRQTLSQQLESLNAELAPLTGTLVDPGDVILEAQLPRRPADPNPLLVLPAGLMAGLLVGIGVAAWRERADKRIHGVAELERIFGLASHAMLRAVGRGPNARVDHDVRALYHSLRADVPDRGEAVLLVGPDSPDTAERLAYSLAVVAARSGSSAAYLTRPGSPVLLDRRRGGTVKPGHLHLPDYEDLGVMDDGQLRSAGLGDVLRGLAAKHDFLVLGLPNDDPAVDLPILGRHVDLAVVVVRIGVTRRDTLAVVLADLTRSGVDRVLAVTVDLGRRRLRRDLVDAGQVFSDSAEPARPLPIEHRGHSERSAPAVARRRPR